MKNKITTKPKMSEVVCALTKQTISNYTDGQIFYQDKTNFVWFVSKAKELYGSEDNIDNDLIFINDADTGCVYSFLKKYKDKWFDFFGCE